MFGSRRRSVRNHKRTLPSRSSPYRSSSKENDKVVEIEIDKPVTPDIEVSDNRRHQVSTNRASTSKLDYTTPKSSLQHPVVRFQQEDDIIKDDKSAEEAVSTQFSRQLSMMNKKIMEMQHEAAKSKLKQVAMEEELELYRSSSRMANSGKTIQHTAQIHKADEEHVYAHAIISNKPPPPTPGGDAQLLLALSEQVARLTLLVEERSPQSHLKSSQSHNANLTTKSSPQSHHNSSQPNNANPTSKSAPIVSRSSPSSKFNPRPFMTVDSDEHKGNPPLNGTYFRMHELPPFDGRPEDWPMFFEAYNESNLMFEYTPLENMMRLRKALKGEAKRRVECLLMHHDHVEQVMESLELQFGRPDQLVQSQISRVQALASISKHQLHMLAPFAADVTNLAVFLDREATQHHLANPVLMDELVKKLPLARQFDWAVHADQIKPYATIRDFADWITTIARVACLIAKPQINQKVSASRVHQADSGNRTNNSDNYRSRNKDKHVLLQVGNPFAPDCSYCKGTHRTGDCYKFKKLSIADRWRETKLRHWCFGCLRLGHSYTNCHPKRECGVDGCTNLHHPLLHTQSDNKQDPKEHSRTNLESDCNKENSKHHAASSVLNCRRPAEESCVLFRILPVTLYGPTGKKIDTFALLDGGSELTMLDAKTAGALDLVGPIREHSIEVFDGRVTKEKSKVVTLDISGIHSSKKRFTITDVMTTKDLKLPMQTVKLAELHTKYRHLRGLPFAEYRNAEPTILLGLKHSFLGTSSKVFESSSSEPIAVKTKLGWMIYGPQGDNLVQMRRVLHCRETADSVEDRMDKMVSEYFTTENFGVKIPERKLESDEDQRARHLLETTTVRVGSRFETGLLWSSDKIRLPDSYEMACKRLVSVEKKMKRDAVYAEKYREQIESFVEKGYARKLTPSEANYRDERTWYLPHFGVQNINKPGKVRLVFDAAATVNGTSLNSVLLKGPDENTPLANILFQFRMGEVGVCGDIREMFLQIRIRPSDQNSQRFLWRNGNPGANPDTYVMEAMTFGATCSPSSAQFVKNKNASDFEAHYPAAAHTIKTQHYVDDYVASYSSEEEAIRITTETIAVHSQGGFELRGLVSNRPQVLAAIGAVAEHGQPVNLQSESLTTNKILGMQWDTRQDAFVFTMRFDRMDQDIMTGRRLPTKRELLSVAMSVFDPFGILADFMIHVKLMIQELWKIGIGWDEKITTPIAGKWQAWCLEVQRIRMCQVPRCYSPRIRTAKEVQLHIFADASESAFAAVAYWRITFDGNHTTSFIVGKTKCAPLKKLSVPRLELQAAVLATRLMNSILECHKDLEIASVTMWTDSMTVLHWIRSSKRRYKQFVAHRIAEILDSVDSTRWRWLSTSDNVADDATRAKSAPHFNCESRWLKGPPFLCNEDQTWPVTKYTEQDAIDEEELQPRFVGILQASKLLNINDFSGMIRLCRVVAWVRRFVYNSTSNPRSLSCIRGELSVKELDEATNLLCRIAQREGFPEEYDALLANKPIDRQSNLLVLMPYMDSNKLMRLYGRTDAANAKYLSEDMKRPVLLPKKHHFTMLVVRHWHDRMHHQNEDAIIVAVRQRYWVPHLRSLVRTIKRDCQQCKIQEARPVEPVMGQLPSDRLEPYVRPFQYTGLDFFGPVYITIGRRQEKRWVALFTCLTIRAVHLELASDLSTDSCLLCVRNFCNVRGIPSRIRSDNGTNFVGADNVIRQTKDFFDHEAIKANLATKHIEWRFNCPANPEAGGAWERMVRCIKRVLGVTLKEVAPRVETLRSLLFEAANIINSRPLTHVPINPSDCEPITPNHFLLGHANITSLCGPIEPKMLCSRKQWRIGQQLKNQFWSRWVREYLPELTRRMKNSRDPATPLTIGDLVLICDANLSRGQWRRGRVSKVIHGTDGRVRTAEVQTTDGVLRRPVNKLAVLDVSSEAKSGSPHGGEDVANCSSDKG